MSDETPPATLAEMRQILADLPGPVLEAGTAAAVREAKLTKPAGSLGRLEDIAHWMATWQGRHPPTASHPRTAVFAGNHGVAAQGVSAYPAAVTAQMVQNFIAGGAAVNQLCRAVDADLRVYEMSLEEPTADFTKGPAMSEEDCALAIAYGMTAVEPGIDLLAVGEMGIANTTAAAALAAALWGGDAADWVGPGTGVAGAALQHKITVVRRAVDLHAAPAHDPFELLRRLGGRELAAIVGAIMAARRARVPVLHRRLCRDRGGVGPRQGGCARARPLPCRALLGRAGAPASARTASHEAAARSRHAARRGLGRDARHRHRQGRRRLPHRHGDLRRGRGERERGRLSPHSPCCMSEPRRRARPKA